MRYIIIKEDVNLSVIFIIKEAELKTNIINILRDREYLTGLDYNYSELEDSNKESYVSDVSENS